MTKNIWATFIIALLLLGCASDEQAQDNTPPTVDLSELGRLLFFDENLSTPAG